GASLTDAFHNGGGMKFGNDGMLYVTTGDAGNDNNSGDKSNVHGSLMRLTDDGKTPNDNPFTTANGYISYHCADTNGKVPVDAPDGAVCSEIYASGLRNPFRIAMDPNEDSKVRMAISDVGARTWEEINYGGTDYAGVDYGYKTFEGPCIKNSDAECPLQDGFVEPFHFYQHREGKDGCVAGSVFVPEGVWPEEYKFLFIDFTWYEIYSLTEDTEHGCRECSPPVSNFRNETFHHSIWYPGDGKNEARMLDLFFGPYKDEQALYVVKFGNHNTVLRIRYTGIHNDPPVVNFEFEERNYGIDEEVQFIGNLTTDTEDDALSFNWFFGDGAESSEINPTHRYNEPGVYKVTLIVVDALKQEQEKTDTVMVGTPPSANIILPTQDSQFFVGQVLTVKGEAFYVNGTAIDESELEWEVRKHHDDHYHPFLDSTNGNNIELPPAPEPEDYFAATNSYIEVILRARDEIGLTVEVSRMVYPILVTVGIETEPEGLNVLVEGESISTEQEIVSWLGNNLHLMAEDQPPFEFVSWPGPVRGAH
ncbi:MAG: hypothetical protein SGARI_000971, partial [Bacillariaceae sp.]